MKTLHLGCHLRKGFSLADWVFLSHLAPLITGLHFHLSARRYLLPGLHWKETGWIWSSRCPHWEFREASLSTDRSLSLSSPFLKEDLLMGQASCYLRCLRRCSRRTTRMTGTVSPRSSFHRCLFEGGLQLLRWAYLASFRSDSTQCSLCFALQSLPLLSGHVASSTISLRDRDFKGRRNRCVYKKAVDWFKELAS